MATTASERSVTTNTRACASRLTVGDKFRRKGMVESGQLADLSTNQYCAFNRDFRIAYRFGNGIRIYIGARIANYVTDPLDYAVVSDFNRIRLCLFLCTTGRFCDSDFSCNYRVDNTVFIANWKGLLQSVAIVFTRDCTFADKRSVDGVVCQFLAVCRGGRLSDFMVSSLSVTTLTMEGTIFIARGIGQSEVDFRVIAFATRFIMVIYPDSTCSIRRIFFTRFLCESDCSTVI